MFSPRKDREKAMPRKAPKIGLSEKEQKNLEKLIRKETAGQERILRTKIVLLADAGK